MANCPLPSVTTERVFSISAGLEASTVTPGSTASEASLTTPAMVPSACAYDETGIPRRQIATRQVQTALLIRNSFVRMRGDRSAHTTHRAVQCQSTVSESKKRPYECG